MEDEKVATFALTMKIYSELLSDYLDDYENKLLQAGSVQVDILRDINLLLLDLKESLPQNKLDELVKPILIELKEHNYYLEEK